MKALCQEYRNGAGAMSREMERMIPTAFSVATMSERPCTAAHNAAISYANRLLRLLIIKAEQQKIPPFYANNSVTSPAIIIVWIISPMVIPRCRRKEYGQDVRLV